MENMVQLGSILGNAFGAWPEISNFSQTAAATLITAAWQSAVVAIGLGLSLRLAPRTTATHRFVIWTAGFLVIVGLPFLPLLSHLAGAASQTSVSLGFTQTRPWLNPWLNLDARWSFILTSLWVAASLFRAVELGLHSIHLRKLWKTAHPVLLPLDCASLPSIPARKPVELCTSRRVERPSVIGFLAPRILIPEWLFNQLTPAELDQIVLHEAEHLRRADDWTNLLQKLSLVLFPLNPALLWVERQLCLEREMACDDGVIRRTNAPRAYAACLTSLAERSLQHRTGTLSPGTLSLGAWQHRSELVRRVHSVLLRKQALGTFGARSLLAGLGFSLVLGAVELARCPQLIAFVPVQNAQTAISHGTAPLRLATQRMTRQTATFAQAPTSQLVSSRSLPQPHVTYLKADMPARQPHSIYTPRTAPRAAKISYSPSPVPGKRLLKAEVSDQRSRPTSEPPQEQAWIVLTTWEQVEQPAQETAQEIAQTNPQPSDTVAKPETGQVDQTDQAVQTDEAAQATGKRFTQIVGKITITRLIFRVLPAAYVSPSPATTPTRTAWLVFQL